MNRSTLIRFALGLALVSASIAAGAQNSLQIIPLRHRTVDQVLPLLQPLVEPGGTISGQSNQLFVRTSPANLAELQRALESIDQPARRLQVSVRFDDGFAASRSDVQASGRIGSGGANVELRADGSRTTGDERVDQRVLVQEGGRATILTGQSRPLRQRQIIQTPAGPVPQEITVVQELTTGFEIVPRVSGDRVFVDVLAQRAQADVQRGVATTAAGRLGEWFELGAVATDASRDARGIGSFSRSASGETRRVWIRVDALP